MYTNIHTPIPNYKFAIIFQKTIVNKFEDNEIKFLYYNTLNYTFVHF